MRNEGSVRNIYGFYDSMMRGGRHGDRNAADGQCLPYGLSRLFPDDKGICATLSNGFGPYKMESISAEFPKIQFYDVDGCLAQDGRYVGIFRNESVSQSDGVRGRDGGHMYRSDCEEGCD